MVAPHSELIQAREQIKRAVEKNGVKTFAVLGSLNPLSPISLYENEISLDMITACLNVQLTRIKEVITDDSMS